MWDYVAFFGYNFLFFLFALFVWHVFPRPVPYDYTTIPGLKPDPSSWREGNLREMRSSGRLCTFLEHLHEDYGALASFYWARTYVVAVGSFALWSEMIDWSRKIPAEVDVIPIVSETASAPVTLSLAPIGRVLEKIRSTPPGETPDDDADWRLAIDVFMDSKSGSDDRESEIRPECVNELIRDRERALVSRSFAEGADCNWNRETTLLRSALICRALKRGLSRAAVVRPSLTEPRENGTRWSLLADSRLSDWPEECILRSAVLECIRLAVPFEYVVYTFGGEIDLLGHPIPAGVPILVYAKDVLLKRSTLAEPASYMANRFQRKSEKAFRFGQCLLRLPYVDSLAAVVAARFCST